MKQIFILSFAFMLTIGCKSKQEVVPSANANDQVERRGHRGTPPSIDEVFAMDVNKDGLLSKTEIGESPMARRFDKIDANSDGYISREEFRNAPKPQRGQRGQRNQ